MYQVKNNFWLHGVNGVLFLKQDETVQITEGMALVTVTKGENSLMVDRGTFLSDYQHRFAPAK